ncbi:MAG TPA: thiamine phosphate synthase [Candidatus Acidoferrales bacterium]|nr:thiamine phosphate synthase [Candidatus Acidoferrales bacterium]
MPSQGSSGFSRGGEDPPIVCYVTNRKVLGSADSATGVLAKIRVAVAGGVNWVQIRERDMPPRELMALARAAIGLANDVPSGRRMNVIVNDRLDVAIATGAAGVHLGGESIPAREVVRWRRAANAPAEFLVGVSCHSLEDAREAEASGASYIFLGPVFDTPSKRSFGQPQGIERLAEVCGAVQIPVVAIGGVNAENGGECLRAGAAGIAAIRWFQETSDPEALRQAVAQLGVRAR